MTVLSKFLTAILAAGSLVSVALAHGEPTTPEAINRRDLQIAKSRRSLEKCASKLKARDRVERRIKKRQEFIDSHIEKKRSLGHNITPNPLHRREVDGDSLFQEVACVLAPEVTVGPYYVEGELIREDISEGAAGLELLLDLQFVDVNTCEVIPNAYVDFWHCNTTGTYSGFAAEGTDGLTFNRGLQPTDSEGVVQITTTFPGWYAGRATHIHIASHLNGTVTSEGTYEGGTVQHIGQLFFPEDILEQVEELDVYNTNTVTRVLNANDGIFNQENTGYDAVTDISYLGSSFEDGLIATISVGVDATADYTDALLGGAGGGGGGGAPPMRN